MKTASETEVLGRIFGPSGHGGESPRAAQADFGALAHDHSFDRRRRGSPRAGEVKPVSGSARAAGLTAITRSSR